MKKQLIIVVSAIQLLSIQPLFAQMMKKDMMEDASKQEQMVQDKDEYMDNKMMQKKKAGDMKKMQGMDMQKMMKSKKHKRMMKFHMISIGITTALKWILMTLGIIALWKWIKKQE